MGKVYKLWVEIEMCDMENNDFQDVGEPECIGEFETEEEAYAALVALTPED